MERIASILAAAIDAKSPWTAGHSQRVEKYAVALGREIGMPDSELEEISISATLHVIGKIGIDERILDKPARLTEEEYALVRTHPGQDPPGNRGAIVGSMPGSPHVRSGILYHHERRDGTGYPQGLSGDRTPLIARILCIADVYDAITADRPYRSGMSSREAREFIRENRGVMFDPDLAGPFLSSVVPV